MTLILSGKIPKELFYVNKVHHISFNSSYKERIEIFEKAMQHLKDDFGSTSVEWGEFNRYQRINGDIHQEFNDNLSSIRVGMASGWWGALASYGTRRGENTKRKYGVSGNSFVAVVEFGEKLKPKSMLAGGQSGDPDSPHFDDQAKPYVDCSFKTVAFYRNDVLKRAESRYHPGSEKTKSKLH